MTVRIAVLAGAILASALAGCTEAEGLVADTDKGGLSGTPAQHGAQADSVTPKEKDCVNDALPPGTIIHGRGQTDAEQDG